MKTQQEAPGSVLPLRKLCTQPITLHGAHISPEVTRAKLQERHRLRNLVEQHGLDKKNVSLDASTLRSTLVVFGGLLRKTALVQPALPARGTSSVKWRGQLDTVAAARCVGCKDHA